MLGPAALLGVPFSFTPTIVDDVPPVTPTVEVDDNRLVDENARVIQLRGVNRSGTEYSCVQGLGIFDGPAGMATAYGEVVRTRLMARSAQPDPPPVLPPGAQPI